MKKYFSAIVLTAVVVCCSSMPASLGRVTPESVGMSSEKLQLTDEVINNQMQGSDCHAQEWLQWQDLGKGMQVATANVELFDSNQSISVIRFPAKKFRLDIVNQNGEKADSTSSMAINSGAIAAINGSYFNVRKLTPTTYLKDNRVEVGDNSENELFRVDALLCVKGKKITILPMGEDPAANAKKFKEAIASGPLLIMDGKPVRVTWPDDSFFQKRHPRTFAGITKDGQVYLVVVDGRFPQGIGTTIPETVELCRMLGLENAINLDGGGSSTLWTKQTGVISHPYDNKRYDNFGQRIVPNIIAVIE